MSSTAVERATVLLVFVAWAEMMLVHRLSPQVLPLTALGSLSGVTRTLSVSNHLSQYTFRYTVDNEIKSGFVHKTSCYVCERDEEALIIVVLTCDLHERWVARKFSK